MGEFDVVVLGGGAAGTRVAAEVAGAGRSVALVEAGLIGGESPYLADLPSNSLLLSASQGEPWEDAVARRNEATGGLDDAGPALRLAEADVTVIRGTGRITGPGTVEVAADGTPPGTNASLSYSDLVIATGCEPIAPPIEGLADIPVWTTAESLCSPDLPRRLVVLGGGPAGCELTQIYAAFGSRVTLVEAETTLLGGEPAFAGEILAAALRRAGAEVCLGSPAAKAERTADGITLALDDGMRIDADRLLLASGRRPRIGDLGLDALGIAVAPGLPLPTTTSGRVEGAPGRVWAVGDVTGVTHTHAGRYQAGVVAANILGQRREADYSAIPRCVFTTPSVFSVGRVGTVSVRVNLSDTTRGWLGQDDLGCLELYAESGRLVGAVAVGPDAASWMAEVTLAIKAKIPVPVLADTVHVYPTYTEALEVAFRELAGPGQEKEEFGPLSELDMETPEGDAIEQHQEVVADENTAGAQGEVRFEVDEADAAEQARAIGFDDDDYR